MTWHPSKPCKSKMLFSLDIYLTFEKHCQLGNQIMWLTWNLQELKHTEHM